MTYKVFFLGEEMEGEWNPCDESVMEFVKRKRGMVGVPFSAYGFCAGIGGFVHVVRRRRP